jgi:hypothetical protein
MPSTPTPPSQARKIVKVTPMQAAMMRGSLDATQILFKVNVGQAPGTEVVLPVSNKPDAKQMKPPYRHYSLAFLVDVNHIAFTPGPDGNFRGDFEFGAQRLQRRWRRDCELREQDGQPHPAACRLPVHAARRRQRAP